MAKNYNDSAGVSIASPFILKSQTSLDPRNVVNTKEGLNELITNGASYEGLSVYVKDEMREYIFTSPSTYTEKSNVLDIDILNEDETLAIQKIGATTTINTSVIKRYSSMYAFPNRGVDNALYIDTTEKRIYMYFEGIYTLLNDYSEIEVISGGDATNGSKDTEQ